MYRSIDMTETGKNIRKMLDREGYNVRDIQEYLHLSCPQSIYRWFKGKALPSVEHLSALSGLLHVHMEELLVLQDTPIFNSFEEIEDPEIRRLLAYVFYIGKTV